MQLMRESKSSEKYLVKKVKQAKEIALIWIEKNDLTNLTVFGLPEVDDRYHIWRVPIISKLTKEKIGEVVIDAISTLISEAKTTDNFVLKERVLSSGKKRKKIKSKEDTGYEVSQQRNTIAFGDAEKVLQDMAAKSADLIFTSPPYYNARPEYSDYITYEDYLLKMRKVIQNCHRVLNEGRFFVINISPVLIRRSSRGEASKRIAVPFDIHRIFVEEGFDFIDDIIWVKPEGAGWATGRGRRFAADRNPLQYKAVPVTEYILVYRKKTDKLIDWNIRTHPDQKAVKNSKIEDSYEKTNIWRISPSYSKNHPAIFPIELAERVIKYYSFLGDVVLDPFAGIGTAGKAAVKLGRRFVLIELNKKYIDILREEVKRWLGIKHKDVLFLNCESSDEGLSPLF
jgi:DNA modification methylase